MVASSRRELAASLRMACLALAAAGGACVFVVWLRSAWGGEADRNAAVVALETTKLPEHLQKG